MQIFTQIDQNRFKFLFVGDAYLLGHSPVLLLLLLHLILVGLLLLLVQDGPGTSYRRP